MSTGCSQQFVTAVVSVLEDQPRTRRIGSHSLTRSLDLEGCPEGMAVPAGESRERHVPGGLIIR